MKTKKFKTVLPALAILLAMGLSFAVEANSVTQTGYYFDPATQQAKPAPVPADCNQDETTVVCRYGIYQLYADEGLTQELYKITP